MRLPGRTAGTTTIRAATTTSSSNNRAVPEVEGRFIFFGECCVVGTSALHLTAGDKRDAHQSGWKSNLLDRLLGRPSVRGCSAGGTSY